MADKKVNLCKKSDIDVTVYMDISDSENPFILPIELEPKEIPIPEHIIQIKTRWARPCFTTQNVIDANCYVDKISQGRTVRVFDENASTYAHMRVLLKEWNMQEFEPSLRLVIEKSIDNPMINVLSNDTMQRIGVIDPPEIVSILVNRFMGALIEKKFKKALEKENEVQTKTV